jgi:hypothetical protein
VLCLRKRAVAEKVVDYVEMDRVIGRQAVGRATTSQLVRGRNYNDLVQESVIEDNWTEKLAGRIQSMARREIYPLDGTEFLQSVRRRGDDGTQFHKIDYTIFSCSGVHSISKCDMPVISMASLWRF